MRSSIMREQMLGRESDNLYSHHCYCDIGQGSSLLWALVGHERGVLDNLKSLGWERPEVGMGGVMCREGPGPPVILGEGLEGH